MSLEEVEGFLIKKSGWARFDGNVSQAAKALGLSRSALYRRLQKIRPVKPSVLADDTFSALDPTSSRPGSYLRFDQRILLLALAAGFPAALVALIFLWTGDSTPKVQWTLTVFIVGVWTGCSFSVRHRVVLPLQTLSNLLAALRESDFSIRARGASGDDPLGAVMLEVNVLASTLARPAARALEAGALLRTVMVEIRRRRLHVRRRAHTAARETAPAERLLAQPAEQLLGRTADELGLHACLVGQSPRIEDVVFPGGIGGVGKCGATNVPGRAAARISSWCSRMSRCQACRSSSRSGRLDVGEHQELNAGGRPAGTSCAALPNAPIRRERRRSSMRGDWPTRHACRPSSSGGAAEQLLRRLREQPLAGAVHEPQCVRAVEREDGDVDLHHHRPQERTGLERAEPLVVQRRCEHVHFEHDRAERIVAARAAARESRSRFRGARPAGSTASAAQDDTVADAERAAGSRRRR